MSIIIRTAVILVEAGERMNLWVFTQGGCNSFGPELYFKLSDSHLPHVPLYHRHLLMNSHQYPVCNFLLLSSYHHLHDFCSPAAQTPIVLGSPTSITLNIPCLSYSHAAFWILSPIFGSISNTWLSPSLSAPASLSSSFFPLLSLPLLLLLPCSCPANLHFDLLVGSIFLIYFSLPILSWIIIIF